MTKPNKQVRKINKLKYKIRTDKKIIIVMLRIKAEVALEKFIPTGFLQENKGRRKRAEFLSAEKTGLVT